MTSTWYSGSHCASSGASQDSRNTRNEEDMEVCRFHRQYVHATTREQFTAVSLVKDVMMQASVIEVVERSAAKLLRGARKWIQTEVMFLQDLWQVSQIGVLR
jgi:hypothetical protein